MKYFYRLCPFDFLFIQRSFLRSFFLVLSCLLSFHFEFSFPKEEKTLFLKKRVGLFLDQFGFWKTSLPAQSIRIAFCAITRTINSKHLNGWNELFLIKTQDRCFLTFWLLHQYLIFLHEVHLLCLMRLNHNCFFSLFVYFSITLLNI